MNPGWRVIDLTGFKGKVSYTRGNLRITAELGEISDLPLSQIAVILAGQSVSFSGAAITKISEYDIALMICDWRNIPISALYPWNGHSRIAARHLAQADLSLPRKKNAWKQIVQAKIRGQAYTAKMFSATGFEQLKQLADSVRSGDPANLEAQAAKKYWQIVGENNFRRIPGLRADSSFNSCLDYAYTILRGHGIRAINGAGLCGALGIFHRGRNNPYTLVDDLIEPFRPAIDSFILCHLDDYSLDNKETKTLLIESLDQVFDSSGEIIPTRLLWLAQEYGNYVENKIDSLTVPTWRG